MDEQNKPITQQATANVPDYSNEINAMYDAQRASQQQQLESAYNKNLATLQQGREDIAGVYNTQANDLATQYERNRRNNNFQADLNGLNTGTASQMQLAQNNAYMRGYGQLRASQAAAERQADRDIANLAINYKNAVAEALAQNDYQRATDILKEHQRRDAAAQDEARYQHDIRFAEQKYADQMAQQALENQRYDTKWQQSLKEYENQLAQQQLQNERYDTEWAAQQQQYADKLAAQQWEQQYKERAYNDTMSQQQAEDALNAAKIRAAYGDFGGYEALYGKETADAMREFWIQANPNYAYANGLISEDTYNKLLGISSGSGGSSGGSSGGHRGSSNSGSGDDTDAAISQLVIQGVPYAQAIEALNSDSTMSMSEYKKTKAAIDAAYKSTWAGGSNAGMYNAANNSAEQRGTNEWKKPKGVTPTTNSKYSGG